MKCLCYKNIIKGQFGLTCLDCLGELVEAAYDIVHKLFPTKGSVWIDLFGLFGRT